MAEELVEVDGRTLFVEQTRYLGHCCSGISFEAVTRKVVVRLWSDGYQMNEAGRAIVAVFINDEKVPSKRLRLDQEEADYCLFESEKLQKVKIQLVKYSEDMWATVGVRYIELEGELLPQQKKEEKRKLLFIGDSITCGYGNEGICGKDIFTTAQENPWEAYAALTARKLDCKYHLVARSSIGIYSSWTPTGVMNNELLMSMLYPYTDYELMSRYGKAFAEKWQPEKFQPDAVIINLGTNDESYTKEVPERIAAFGKAYWHFLEQVRADYPGAYLFCVTGVMGEILYPEIKRQVEAWQEEKGDLRITSLLFEGQKEADGLGTDWHPSLRTHQKMADKLSGVIKEHLKW